MLKIKIAVISGNKMDFETSWAQVILDLNYNNWKIMVLTTWYKIFCISELMSIVKAFLALNHICISSFIYSEIAIVSTI